MMTKPPQVPVACWNFYFTVDSINVAVERVKSGGGQILNGQMRVPGGGWIIKAKTLWAQSSLSSAATNMSICGPART